jgi:hypothetical protein
MVLELFRMKNYLGVLDIKTPKFIESDATWHLLFCLFIRSIEYTYERVIVDYAKLPMKF